MRRRCASPGAAGHGLGLVDRGVCAACIPRRRDGGQVERAFISLGKRCRRGDAAPVPCGVIGGHEWRIAEHQLAGGHGAQRRDDRCPERAALERNHHCAHGMDLGEADEQCGRPNHRARGLPEGSRRIRARLLRLEHERRDLYGGRHPGVLQRRYGHSDQCGKRPDHGQLAKPRDTECHDHGGQCDDCYDARLSDLDDLDPAIGHDGAFDTQYQPVAQGQGESIEGNYLLQAAAGATGTKTATAAGGAPESDAGATHILALRPVAPTLSIGLPAGTVANDVMIAAVGVRPSSATVTPPAGWTLVRRVDNNTLQTNSVAVYRKVAGASEPASYAWTVTGASDAVGGIQVFSNVDTANPINVESGQATGDSLSHATPSVTTTVANAMLVTAHSFPTSTTWTPPSGMTEAFDSQFQPVPQGQGHSIEGNYAVQAVAGATGTKTATAAGGAPESDPGTTHILALRPAAAATLSIGLPAGTVANDVMIAAVSVRPSSVTVTPPAGWTLVRRVDNNTLQTNSVAVYRKVAGASEPASYAWDVTGSAFAAGGIQAFSNVDTANPIDVENGQATGESLSHATPSVTTTVANAMLVTAHSFPTSTTWTPPTGMTEAFDTQFQPVPQGQGQSIEGNYVVQSAAGATGAKTATAAAEPQRSIRA